ncbi:MAG: N(G),N(G)-dimethylarginine dimethylaminohydrolase [Myxococcales bacterium]|nr:N(G),N(G)-dimethylarginine dimethylaminohydrolase [Myxococcales bacterium]
MTTTLLAQPFTRAIVAPPGPSFAHGLTTRALGAPALDLALAQHARYCEALGRAGLEVTVLPADPEHPDATFVEDTAVVAAGLAVLCRPGAASRRGEVARMRDVLGPRFAGLASIEPPGTLDGGDVCQVGRHFFVGLSARTDAEGARQLARALERAGYTASTIDVRDWPDALHLKSAVAWLGGARLLVREAQALEPAFAPFERVIVPTREAYAANCLWLGRTVLVAADHPVTEARLRALGYAVEPLAMTEMEKMDGGLSCLSLRY